jgi:hypothetical protein
MVSSASAVIFLPTYGWCVLQLFGSVSRQSPEGMDLASGTDHGRNVPSRVCETCTIDLEATFIATLLVARLWLGPRFHFHSVAVTATTLLEGKHRTTQDDLLGVAFLLLPYVKVVLARPGDPVSFVPCVG